MKNVIIEGCDGSGKTTLIDTIFKEGGYVKHSRASSSLDGPVNGLDDWVDADLDRLDQWDRRDQQPTFLYDRHPLISELIYADLRWVNRGVSGQFTNIEWILKSQRRLADHGTLVICLPPYEEVERVMQHQGREAHMAGVFENRYTIWTRYSQFVWPGNVIRYDRTRETVTDLLSTLRKVRG